MPERLARWRVLRQTFVDPGDCPRHVAAEVVVDAGGECLVCSAFPQACETIEEAVKVVDGLLKLLEAAADGQIAIQKAEREPPWLKNARAFLAGKEKP